MKRSPSLQVVLVGLALLAAAALSYGMKPTRKAKDINLEAMVAKQFGDWQTDPESIQVKPSPDVQARLDKLYSQILARTYVNRNGDRIMLTITYGGDQSMDLKAHRQEVCYAAQGFRIFNLVPGAPLELGPQTLPVTRMLAVSGARSEPVTYWFTMGNNVVLSRFERMMVQLRYGLAGEIPDGLLVRVSNISGDEDHSYTVHRDFLQAMLAAMKPEEAAHLTGSSPG